MEGEGQQAFLSEISEEDVEVLRQREEALLQIEVCAQSPHTAVHLQSLCPVKEKKNTGTELKAV